MNNQPLVSIIMPIYNGGADLKLAINSILNQSYINWELIAIDDGSNDNSVQTVLSYSDKRLRLVRNNKNLGLINTLNIGLQHVNGDYIARQDHDDISEPTRLDKQVKFMSLHGLDLCGSHRTLIDINSREIGKAYHPITSETIISCLASTVPFAHGSVMMRRAFMTTHDLRYTTENICEDYALWIKFFECGAHIGNCDEFLYQYRVHPTSLSQSQKKIYLRESKILRRNFIKKNINRSILVLQTLKSQFHILNHRDKVNAIFMAFHIGRVTSNYHCFLTLTKKAGIKVKLYTFLKIVAS